MQLSLRTQSSPEEAHNPARVEHSSSQRNRLIAETLWLVRSLARELLRQHAFSISCEDLESAGMHGLVCASDAFDGRPGTRFSTFAYRRIRGAMFDAIRDGHGSCTRSEMSLMQELRDTSKNALPCLTYQIANIPWHRFSRAEPSDAYENLGKESGAEQLAPDGSQQSLHQRTPERLLQDLVVSERVRAAIASLPTRQRRVVELLYYEHEGSYEAVAQHLGTTRPHIFRVHARALRRLRAALADLET